MKGKAQDFNERAGQMIRELRRAKNWSQQKLGDEIAVTFQQVQKYESGANRMSVYCFVALCLALDASPSRCIKELVMEESR